MLLMSRQPTSLPPSILNAKRVRAGNHADAAWFACSGDAAARCAGRNGATTSDISELFRVRTRRNAPPSDRAQAKVSGAKCLYARRESRSDGRKRRAIAERAASLHNTGFQQVSLISSGRIRCNGDRLYCPRPAGGMCASSVGRRPRAPGHRDRPMTLDFEPKGLDRVW
jgi:hypothetical protein